MNLPEPLPMSEAQAAWLAGILDGEGCLDFTRNSPRVRVKMTDHDLIIRVATLIGGSIHHEAPRQAHHKPCLVTQVHGDTAVAVLRSVLPFLSSRRTARATDLIVAHGDRQARKATRHLKAA